MLVEIGRTSFGKKDHIMRYKWECGNLVVYDAYCGNVLIKPLRTKKIQNDLPPSYIMCQICWDSFNKKL